MNEEVRRQDILEKEIRESTLIRARKEKYLKSIRKNKIRNNKSFRSVSKNTAQVVDKLERPIVWRDRMYHKEHQVIGNLHTCNLFVQNVQTHAGTRPRSSSR